MKIAPPPRSVYVDEFLLVKNKRSRFWAVSLVPTTPTVLLSSSVRAWVQLAGHGDSGGGRQASAERCRPSEGLSSPPPREAGSAQSVPGSACTGRLGSWFQSTFPGFLSSWRWGSFKWLEGCREEENSSSRG